MAADNTTSLTGCIQVYFEKAWMKLPERSFMTPLANSDLGTPAGIPKNGGQFVEMRKFGKFDVPTVSASDDAPKYYAEGAEPTSGETLSADIINIPLAELADYISMGNLLTATDPVDTMEVAMEKLREMIKRWVHQHVNQSFVNQIADTNSFASGGTLPSAFNTIYCGGKQSFAELKVGDLHRMSTWTEARSRMENDGVPKPYGDFYAGVISNAIKNQLIADDPDFNDVVKRHSEMIQKTLVKGMIGDYSGIRWILQDDEYRAALPSVGGLLATRNNSGRVHVGHLLGKGSFAYVDLASAKRRLMPKFKVQDISTTGIETTVGFRIPFKTAVMDNDFGVNIAGTSKFYKGVND